MRERFLDLLACDGRVLPIGSMRKGILTTGYSEDPNHISSFRSSGWERLQKVLGGPFDCQTKTCRCGDSEMIECLERMLMMLRMLRIMLGFVKGKV